MEDYCLRCGRLKKHIRAEKDKMCSSTSWGKTIHFGINHKYKNMNKKAEGIGFLRQFFAESTKDAFTRAQVIRAIELFTPREQPKESWDWRVEFGKIKGLTPSQEDELQFFISTLLQEQREEIKEWAEKNGYDINAGFDIADPLIIVNKDNLIKYLNQ